jgi:transposase
MAKERLPMRSIREILRLRWEQGLRVRQTARSARVSTGKVSQVEQRAKRLGLDWAAVEQLDDEELERWLYGEPKAAGRRTRPQPDPLYMHIELKKKGVTLEVLHLEYLRDHPDGYRYTTFCDVYRKWREKRGVVMHQEHRAGEALFTDYSGKKPVIFDSATGEAIEVELFVAVLGASNYTYVEATASSRVPDWIGANVRALEYIDGVPEMTVPDQHKGAVTVPCRYEPGLQRTFAEMGRHYGMAVVPARPGKARDKAKVEVGVQVAQRWILARIRNERFHSLADLNRRIGELCEELNARPMKRYGGLSRRDLLERAALRPLPAERFEPAEWQRQRVRDDYHVELEGHFYSVPWALLRELVEARMTATTVEMFSLHHRVASHARSYEVGGYTTVREHMPSSHRWWADKDPEQMVASAAKVGTCTAAMARAILEGNFNRNAAWNSAMGLMSLTDKYDAEELERACETALLCNGRSYKSVERILRLGVGRNDNDGEGSGDGAGAAAPIDHDNVRGPQYYH